MARPKKEEMYRNHRITVRFTETEFSIIETAAKQANMSLASYVRTQVLKGKVQTKIEIVADVPEIKKLLAEFGKIGSNLNQIAKSLNTYEQVDIHFIEITVNELRNMIKNLEQEVRGV